ncbi:MAG: SpaA isopeptide-forming pilin-related protein [Acutalibacteraceae bacterium]|nr:SpaA isopeptide-forming pilin-related protein [Acutalibacteraceae bacterium]
MKKYVLMIILTVLVMIQPLAAVADESDRMPDIDVIEKSLTIDFSVQNNEKDIPISGAEISIYKVADLKCEYGSAEYTLLSQYESLKKYKDNKDVTFEGMTVSESNQFSKNIAKLVTDADAVGITDISGKYTFKGLTQGMYLIIETKAYDEADEYEIMDPYIVSVPFPQKKAEENYWEYEIISKPKTAIEAKDEPTTDDSTSYAIESENSSSELPTTDLPGTDPSEVSSQSTGSIDTTEKNYSTPSEASTISVTAEISEPSNPVTRFFDISKVKTGFISNVTIFLMIMFASSFIIVFFAGKKRGEDDDEKY